MQSERGAECVQWQREQMWGAGSTAHSALSDGPSAHFKVNLILSMSFSF